MNENVNFANDSKYISSREIADIIEKPHNDLMKIIRKNIIFLIEGNFSLNEFFIESSYIDSIGRSLPCFLLTKMGCELIANKLTGRKGTLFTATYVKRFNQMELTERFKLADNAARSLQQENHINDINIYTQIVVSAMNTLGATQKQIKRFFNDVCDQFGYTKSNNDFNQKKNWFNATTIAEICGIYSINGFPHNKAVACILNEILYIGDEHKRIEVNYFGSRIGTRVFYDKYAMLEILQWILDLKLPRKIQGYKRNYNIRYE